MLKIDSPHQMTEEELRIGIPAVQREQAYALS